jgi:CheY-like chemotaxis protein
VLLAQNQTFDRGEIELALQSLGWEITVSHSAKESVELWKQNGFELVLVALALDEGDGVEVARAIRTHEGGTRKALIIATIKTGAVQEECRRVWTV